MKRHVVVDEELPAKMFAGDCYFLGGKARKRKISRLVIIEAHSRRRTLKLVEGIDYSVDRVSGLVKFLRTPRQFFYRATYSGFG